jgi:glycosyltransferase involved in cell wall biosynthesis
MPRDPTIWIINHYAGGPAIGTGWRHWELARRWIGAGARTRIFTASTEIGGAHSVTRHGSSEIDGVPFEFVPVPEYRGNGVGRIANMLMFAARVGAHARRVCDRSGERPTLVIGSSPHPFVWEPAMAIARRHRAAFVAEVRDTWPDSLVELSGISPRHPLVVVCARLASRAFRRASMVASSLPRVAEHVESRAGRPVPTLLIPNGADLAQQPAHEVPPSVMELLDSAAADGRRVLLYAGAMGRPNALDQLFHAIHSLPAHERARLTCLMVGTGTERERLEAMAKTHCVEIRFVGPQPQDVVAAIMRHSHAGFIGWLDRPLYRFGVSPQKLSMMLAGGLPVIHAVPDGLHEWARAVPGWICRAEDPASLRVAILEMLHTDDQTLQGMRDASLAFARSAFDWDRIASDSLTALAGS